MANKPTSKPQVPGTQPDPKNPLLDDANQDQDQTPTAETDAETAQDEPMPWPILPAIEADPTKIRAPTLTPDGWLVPETPAATH